MKRLNLDTIEYEFDEDANYEKNGKTYSFVSLKKISTYNGEKKYQNLTIKHEHWEKFKDFLADILEGKEDKPPTPNDDIPF